MKIILFHLSDLHLDDKQGAHPAKIQAATDTLKSFSPFDGIVLIISGDITAKGLPHEYKNASSFIGRLTSSIKSTFSISDDNFKLIIVPGNHDINWNIGTPRSDSTKMRDWNHEEKDEQLRNELIHMKDYFYFSNNNKCFFCSDEVPFGKLVSRKILHFNHEYRIEVNLINTAPFSSNADDGVHYLPPDAIQLLSTPSDADLSLIVMHHSPDWFEFSQKKDLETIINQRCSIAFYGHEHIPGAKVAEHDTGCQIIQQAGGAWWQSSAPNDSSFYVGLLDTDTRSYELKRYIWISDSMIFEESSKKYFDLILKLLNGKSLTYRPDYIRFLMNDDKHAICNDISDYFVFPDLKIDSGEDYAASDKIHTMKALIQFIQKHKYIALNGNSSSGKTTLLKMVYRALQCRMPVVYCGIDDVTGRSMDNIIKELVANTYGDNSYQNFMDPDLHRAIIIDDSHRIQSRHLKKFLRGIENVFDIIIIAAEDSSQFDILQMVKDDLNSDHDFTKISISKLYAAKRSEVISKVVSLKMGDNSSVKRSISRTLEQCMKTYKLGFRTEIDFVVQFADYYCSHIGELDRSDATVFSKVFESSIENAIAPHISSRTESTKDIIVALSEVAHYIHFHLEYPVSSEHISNVITDYCNYYDNRYLTPARFIEIGEQSGLLVKTPNGFTYKFKNKDHLAYFVAKALNRKFNDDGDDSYLKTVVEQSSLGINGDILMFLTYITDNVRIPRLLLEQATSYAQNWEEFDISCHNISFLKSVNTRQLTAPDDNQKEKSLEQQAVTEEQENQIIETTDIYDYNAADVDDVTNQLKRAFLQLQIISRSLSAFISILPGKDRKSVVTMLYQLPNRIFNRWAQEVDKSIYDLVDEILAWQEDDNYEGKKYTREQILDSFKGVSVNLLLNIYYLVALYGVNDSTVNYLSDQEYVDHSINYRLERILFREKVDDWEKLVKDAEDIFEKNDNGIVRNIVSMILRHLTIYSERLPDRERRRIISKYFSPIGQQRIFMNRQKALQGHIE